MQALRSIMPFWIALCTTVAYAQKTRDTFTITPYLALQGYSWREFESGGKELLNESGTRFAFGVRPRYSFSSGKNMYTEMDLYYASGLVDYNGFVQDLQTGVQSPYSTKTRYSGFELVLDIGYNARLSESFRLTPIVGLGYEVWNRDIEDGGPSGYDEKYTVALARFGLNGTYIVTSLVKVHSGILIAYPASISESIDRFPRVGTVVADINLTPGINPRFLFNIGGSVHQVFAVLYIEVWTLSKSRDVKGLHQPESARKYFGVKMGYTIGVL